MSGDYRIYGHKPAFRDRELAAAGVCQIPDQVHQELQLGLDPAGEVLVAADAAIAAAAAQLRERHLEEKRRTNVPVGRCRAINARKSARRSS